MPPLALVAWALLGPLLAEWALMAPPEWGPTKPRPHGPPKALIGLALMGQALMGSPEPT